MSPQIIFNSCFIATITTLMQHVVKSGLLLDTNESSMIAQRSLNDSSKIAQRSLKDRSKIAQISLNDISKIDLLTLIFFKQNKDSSMIAQ